MLYIAMLGENSCLLRRINDNASSYCNIFGDSWRYWSAHSIGKEPYQRARTTGQLNWRGRIYTFVPKYSSGENLW